MKREATPAKKDPMAKGSIKNVGTKSSANNRTAYVTIGIQGLTAIFNLITPSLKERRLWGPVTSIAFFLALSSI